VSFGVEDEPVLVTPRCELWRPQRGDLAGLCRLISDEETRRFLGPSRQGEAAQFERLTRNAGCWALYGYGTFIVRPRGEDEVIASCGVFHSWRGYGADAGMDDVPEAGWIVRADRWGQGLAGEIMTPALDWFDRTHGRQRIACMIEPGNTASEKLAARLGFVPCGVHRIEEEGEPVAINLFERV
jgi:RimJ/RimL family protein N-acetyltransferase